MAGICAWLKRDPRAVVGAAELTAMLEALAGKGDPGIHILTAAGAGVGVHDRFGRGARRMLFEDDGMLAAVDAEIYNFRDFPEGRDPEGFSEAALAARLYREQGDQWWRGIRGVYAAVFFDKRTGSAMAFTDRIGIKQVLYGQSGEGVAVASSIKSIAALPGFKREISRQALFSYMHMECIPTPYTIYEGVRKLESGRGLSVRDGRAEPVKLWDLEFPSDKIGDEAELRRRTFSLLKESVDLQSGYGGGIGETGAFLSGGTDSSSIAGMLNLLHPGRVRTFSIGFDESGYDEMHYARIAAKAYRTDHTEYYVTEKDILEGLPAIVDTYDEPFANSSAIPSYFCAKVARDKGVKTLLGGDGGDEIFGGNSRYVSVLAPMPARNRLLGRSLGPWLKLVPADGPFLRSLRAWCARPFAPLQDRIHDYSIANHYSPRDIFSADFLGGWTPVTPQAISAGYLSRAGTDSPLDRFLYHDVKLTLMDNDLRKVGRMTELAGVQVRYPFLDHRLVEFTGRIPAGLKVKERRLRHLFKDAMTDLLPQEIINKQKHGFGIPIVRWMLRKGKLHDQLKDTLFDGRLERRGIFRAKFTESLYRRSLEDRTTFFGVHLYYIFFLESWLRRHEDRA